MRNRNEKQAKPRRMLVNGIQAEGHVRYNDEYVYVDIPEEELKRLNEEQKHVGWRFDE